MRTNLSGYSKIFTLNLAAIYQVKNLYNAAANKFRLELTGGGEVVGFSFDEGQAQSLTYRKQTFVRVGS